MGEYASHSVVTIGDVNVDWIVTTGDMAAPIAALRMHGRKTITAKVGGSGGGFAQAFHAAGMRSCLIACVGDDPYGREAMESLEKLGVLVSIKPTPLAETGKVLIIESTQGGSAPKAMVSHRGANVLLTLDAPQNALLRESDLLMVSGYALLEPPQSRSTREALQICAAARIPRFIDVVPHEIVRDALSQDYRDGLELCDGIGIELGTARALLGDRTASVDEVLAALQRRFRLIVLRPDNDTQIVSLDGDTTVEPTGYSSVPDRTGYLDRVTAGLLASLVQSGRY